VNRAADALGRACVAALGVGAPNAVSAPKPVSGSASASPRCPECLTAFARKQPTQLFCSPQHKRAYANRWTVRGAVLAPLYAAARATRGGTRGDTSTGSRARADADFLVQKWKDEDAAAGRMPVTDYVAARYRLGLVEVR
jgi:hypothetical protein